VRNRQSKLDRARETEKREDERACEKGDAKMIEQRARASRERERERELERAVMDTSDIYIYMYIYV